MTLRARIEAHYTRHELAEKLEDIDNDPCWLYRSGPDEGLVIHSMIEMLDYIDANPDIAAEFEDIV